MISEQMRLRRRLKALKAQQARRIVMVDKKKQELDECVEREQRVIDDMEARVTIREVKR